MRYTASAAVFLAGSAIGVLGTTAFRGQPLNGAPRQDFAASITQLREEIRSIAVTLSGLQRTPADVPQPIQAVRLEESVSQSALDTCSRLEAQMQVLMDRIGTTDLARMESDPPTAKSQDVAATARVRAAIADSRDDVVAYHFCWSPLHVYRAYGRPNSVIRSGQDIHWVYYPDDSDDGFEIKFEDGLVTRLGPYRSPNPRR
jgi:hypothetical protein